MPDLPRPQAISALQNFRSRYYKNETQPTAQILEEVYNRVGGRLTFLNRVAKSPEMLQTCEEICSVEKTWFLNNCWILGEVMDDDVMDQQKYASSAMLLAKALVDQEKTMGKRGPPEGQAWSVAQIPLYVKLKLPGLLLCLQDTVTFVYSVALSLQLQS